MECEKSEFAENPWSRYKNWRKDAKMEGGLEPKGKNGCKQERDMENLRHRGGAERSS